VDNPPVPGAAGAAAAAVSHIPQSLKKNFSQITHHTKKTIDTHPQTHRQSLIEKKFF
jgi:hypothetical protein